MLKPADLKPLLSLRHRALGLQWSVMLLLSAIFVVALEALRLPAALMLGPMCAGIIVAVSGGRVKVSQRAFVLAQGVIGCMIARSITPSILVEILKDWPLFLGTVVSVVIASNCLGLLLARRKVLPGTTAMRSAGILGVEINDEGAAEISRRSRGTARIANRLLRRIRDYAQVRANGRIDLGVAVKAMELLEVDETGLDEMDLAILRTLIEKYGGRPVGVGTLAVSVGEEPDTIEEVYEPFLIQRGFINRTPRGREATPAAYRHLGLTPPASVPREGQVDLFGDES